ncbi:MAG: type II toxin-antitoxin system HipA family toxin, partial [Hyphomicrobiaceae bacterium]|nr:type II toxin-antitoxin system HipA family toxin [Hyphomicrobiaceae bacterium]
AAALFLPWAANLLPEGSQLKAIGASIGAATNDVIAILAEIGRDTAGALSIGQPGTTNPANWRPVGTGAALERILNELPNKPFLAGEDGVSMSLAGVQSKLGVALDTDGRICIPLGGAPSTHILKPDTADRLFGSVHNEALCLTLARCCALNAPHVTTGKAGARTYFLIDRYDRYAQADKWRRLHQEDFCQALGKPPTAKYEANLTGIKGPTFADMFALTRNAMAAPDLLALLDYAIFNVLVCNTDAHAKNYSLMISGRGFRLAPLYDVMCAAAWDGVTRNMAQKIAGKNRGDHLQRRHWESWARECGLNPTGVVARVRALAGSVQTELAGAVAAVGAMPAGPHVMLPEFAKAIEARVRVVLAGLEEGGGPSTRTARSAKPEPGLSALSGGVQPKQQSKSGAKRK